MESLITKFEKIKKYDEKFPAFYNTRLLELKEAYTLKNKNSSSILENTPENILYIQLYLLDSDGNINELQLKLGILVTKHPMLPLLIFNYNHLNTPHDSLIGLECRGLVLEDKTWRVISKPMNRFFNWGEIDIKNAPHPNFDKTQFDFENFSTQSKEDGSLMVLYYYVRVGKWMLNTRTFFLNEVSEKIKIVMAGINEVYVGEVIKTFENSLINSNNLDNLDNLGGEKINLQILGEKFLNPNHTYCFEFCSHVNKIVRNYEKDTVYLLAIINNLTFTEFDSKIVDDIANLIGAMRPVDYNLKTFEEILESMKELMSKDPSLEGFVIKDKNSSRWKIKSPSYFFLHHIHYDFMRTPFPKDLVPLILLGEGTELFSILELNGLTTALNEVRKQWDFCDKKLKDGYKICLEDFEKTKDIEDLNDFELALCSTKTPLTQILKDLKKLNLKEEKDLNTLWHISVDLLIEKLFTKKEQNPPNIPQAEIKTTNISKYKKIDQAHPMTVSDENLKIIMNEENWWKIIDDELGLNGIAKNLPYFKEDEWIVECHCGKIMNLFSVPEYMYSHKCFKFPKCGFCKVNKIDKNKFKGKMSNKVTHTILIYQCECGLAHETHQKQSHILNERKRRPMKGKPLGVPCSDLGLVYRHRLHEELEIVMGQFKWDKDQIYWESAKILDVDVEDAHVGMLGVSQCRELILAFRDMRGRGEKNKKIMPIGGV